MAFSNIILQDALLKKISELRTNNTMWLNKYMEDNYQVCVDEEEYSQKHSCSSEEYCEYRLTIIDKEEELLTDMIVVYQDLLNLRIKGTIRNYQKTIKELKEMRKNLQYRRDRWYNRGVC